MMKVPADYLLRKGDVVAILVTVTHDDDLRPMTVEEQQADAAARGSI